LHQEFGGQLKISAQHFSYDHSAGKNLYRVNAYLEIPEYGKGDVIARDGKYYFILGISTNVKAEDLATGSQESFPYEKGTAERLPIVTTTVSSIDPLEVLHPDDYQSVVPTNSKYAPAELDIDDEVSVAVDGDYLFLIPHTAAKGKIVKKRKRHSQKRKTKDDDLINKN
jgi:NMD protein affecting ribosome stability and mRNA decay